jgi:hypothetical protein
VTERDSGKVKHFGMVALRNNVSGSVEEQDISPVVSLHNIVVKVQNNLILFVAISGKSGMIQNQPNSGESGDYSGFESFSDKNTDFGANSIIL